MQNPEPDPARKFAEFQDAIDQILESVDGYRAKCLERGYSATAAEAMALEFHSMLMRQAAN